MMNFYDMLNELENKQGSLAKEAYLIYILKHVRNAEAFFRFTFNDEVYGVKEQTFKNAYKDRYPSGYNHISEYLELQTRELMPRMTVQKLIEFGAELQTISGAFQEFRLKVWFNELPGLKAKWFCRAILKDLRCGMKVKSVNKCLVACGMKPIEKFAMQLCDKLDLYDEEMVKKKITFPCVMECKYDGIRIQAEVWENDDATMGCSLTSRRGKDRTHLYPEIVEELKKVFYGQHVILDCEVISRSFQSLTRIDDDNPRKLIIWDLLMQEELQYESRWDNLVELASESGIIPINEANDKEGSITELKDNQINKVKVNHLFLAEHYSCSRLQEAQDYYEELNKRGEEGIIIKLLDSPYVRDSRKYMFKCKKVHTADLKCFGYKLGEGKRTGMVATLELIDKSGTIQVDVGSGIDDEVCKMLTANIKSPFTPNFIGKIVEIAYNEITETGSIRNPRFKGFRDDKEEPDDLSTAEVRQGV